MNQEDTAITNKARHSYCYGLCKIFSSESYSAISLEMAQYRSKEGFP